MKPLKIEVPVKSKFFLFPKKIEHARLSILCFPYAGAGASIFLNLISHLSSDVQPILVQLPGRESRIDELPFESMDDLMANLLPDFLKEIEGLVVFWGHSMGGLVAYELSRRLLCEERISPILLIISARQAPSSVSLNQEVSNKLLTCEDLIQRLSYFNHTPDGVYKNKEIMKLLLPRFQADINLIENFQLREPYCLKCPIVTMHGRNDKIVLEETINAWKHFTCKDFFFYPFSGGHFFLHEESEEVMQTLNRKISETMALLEM